MDGGEGTAELRGGLGETKEDKRAGCPQGQLSCGHLKAKEEVKEKQE